MPLASGHRLGAYEIVCPLGAGGMGEVYRARDARLGRDVALKVLPPEVVNEPGRLERFDREARAIAALNHPHIVTIFSTEEAGGVRFLTMELVDGCTLIDLVTPGGLAMPRFLDIAVPLADALAAAHQKQITHRDLKPGNVMVSHDGRVKVLDFGLARVGGADAGEQALIATQAPITHQGMIVGTMPYMSPEQVEGRPLDPRSDLFSLGVIFYELLSGERPFKGSSSPALMSAILRDTPSSVTAQRADVPEALDRLMARLLEKRPDDREQTARDVYNELKHVRRSFDDRPAGVPRAENDRGTAGERSSNLWIAVLPFAVRGADADAEALATGLTEDIATSLARFPGLSVVAAQSTRSFKDSALDVGQIAARLSARYIVGGNVRKSAATIRVTVQLIDAHHNAQQLWSETYDRRLEQADVFTVQDDVTDHIVATLADQQGVLARSMARALHEGVPIGDATANQLLIYSWAFQQNPVPAQHAQLRATMEAMLGEQPDNANLWAALSHLYINEHSLLFNPLPDPLGRAERAARRAIALDHGHQNAWLWLALICFHRHDRRGFDEASERALRINPRNAHAMAWIGNILTHIGECERGSALTERAMQINPAHPGWLHVAVFNRHFAAGEFDAALPAARRINAPDFFWMHFAIAAAAGQLGLAGEGKAAADAMTRTLPALADPANLRDFVTRWYWPEETIERLVEGVQRASGGVASPKPPSSTSGSTRGGALSVAVLPFLARSSDDESKTLADGLTDDITSGLSRFGYLKVLSRSVSERLAHEHTQVHTQARYAIEGHVRKAGPTLRVGLTLVDTQSGTNLWTHSYDRDAGAGTFAMQDDIASAVVATIGDQTGVLMRAMATAIADRPIEQLSIAELVVRYHLYTENFRPDEHLRLRDAFERALEREPRAAEGWACLAMLYEQEHGFGFNRQPETPRRQRHAAERATEIDPRSQQAWVAMASVFSFERDLEAFKAAAERAVSINPLNADMVALIAVFMVLPGEYDRAEALIHRARALKSHHPGWYYFPTFSIHYQRKEYEQALRETKATNMPLHPFAHLGAAAVSGQLGRLTEARAAFGALRQINAALLEPEVARRFWSLWIWREAAVDHLVEGLMKAHDLVQRAAEARPASDTRPADQASIAVLPFADLSEKKDQDWFCDGIAEEILNALAPLPGLRVAARASAFSFRGKSDDLRAIADKLNVTTVLEGSVRRAGDRVRITTQLSDAREGRQLWSERFDREMKDIFDVQEEIARAIVDRLKLSLSSGGARLVPKATANLDAYQQLLKGRVLLERRGSAIFEAITCFEQAVALDPDLAEAHALLGDAHRLTALYGMRAAHDAMPFAKTAAERARAIDPGQAEALATLASVAHAYDWDFPAAWALSDRAIAADPAHARSLAERSIMLALLDTSSARHQQAVLDSIARARHLDPLSAWVSAIESTVLGFIGRFDEARLVAERSLAMDAGNFTARMADVRSFGWLGRHEEAARAAGPALAMSGRNPVILMELAAAHAALGDVAAAGTVYEELRERAQSAFVGFAPRAAAAASAGRLDEARALLADAIAARDSFLVYWKAPGARALLNDPACAALMRTTPLMGTPDGQ